MSETNLHKIKKIIGRKSTKTGLIGSNWVTDGPSKAMPQANLIYQKLIWTIISLGIRSIWNRQP